MFAVEAKSLSKVYGKEKVPAVKEVSFTVDKGELFGLIGPDGAGKSSLFRIFTTLLLPDGGSASVMGLDVVKDYKQIRKKVGYMPGKFSLYQDLTIEENIQFFATVFGASVEENYELIRDIYVQLEPFKNRRAGKLSGGMKQKLALCCALIHQPEVLFLDEPTTGVDPVSRKEFWEMLRRLKAKGISILVSTPYMDEAALCDKIALIQEGNILSIDTPEAIVDAFPQTLYAVGGDSIYSLLQASDKCHLISFSYAFGENIHVVLNTDSATETELQKYFLEMGFEKISVSRIKPTIEDCFIGLLKKV